jgi:hypothetical protein
MHLKQKQVKTLENVSFEQINQMFTGNDIWTKMQDYEKKYYYRYF